MVHTDTEDVAALNDALAFAKGDTQSHEGMLNTNLSKNLLANALEQKPVTPLAAIRGVKEGSGQDSIKKKTETKEPQVVGGKVWVQDRLLSKIAGGLNATQKGGVVDVRRKPHETRTTEQEPGIDTSKYVPGVPAGEVDMS